MKPWLKKKWKTKSGYIISFFGLIAFGAIKFVYDGKSLTSVDLGMIIGTITACLVLFGPIVFVDVKNIKIGKPKDKYVEPSQIRIGLFYIVGIILASILMLLINALLILSEVTILTVTEGVIGSAIMMFSILSVLFLPVTIYMLNAKMRYKRIVEYKTPEWKSLQK
ncbi:MAG TPA: hypothetical protein VGO98_01950 [Candidatus Saccharimonadales bacterium]|jgi:hypothetical protein|nr:hypothetical protein [Candidatus Saccharimonadales bacterium]